MGRFVNCGIALLVSCILTFSASLPRQSRVLSIAFWAGLWMLDLGSLVADQSQVLIKEDWGLWEQENGLVWWRHLIPLACLYQKVQIQPNREKICEGRDSHDEHQIPSWGYRTPLALGHVESCLDEWLNMIEDVNQHKLKGEKITHKAITVCICAWFPLE